MRALALAFGLLRQFPPRCGHFSQSPAIWFGLSLSSQPVTLNRKFAKSFAIFNKHLHLAETLAWRGPFLLHVSHEAGTKARPLSGQAPLTEKMQFNHVNNRNHLRRRLFCSRCVKRRSDPQNGTWQRRRKNTTACQRVIGLSDALAL